MIALAMSMRAKFGHQIAAGVMHYASERSSRRWSDLVHIPDALQRPGGLSRYRLEGLIVAVYSRELADEILALGIPAVNVSGSLRGLRLPSVRIDNERIGVAAAEYFLLRGYRHFAYVPQPGQRHAFIADRGRGFLATALAAGAQASWYGDWPDNPFPIGAARGRGGLTSWLASLPKPLALFTSSDYAAAEIHAQVAAAGMGVPEQVAILGVGDEHEAHFGASGISSIETPFESAGYQAAAMLDEMLDGEAPPRVVVHVLPTRVITRASTDARAVDDATALAALRFIRENACRGIDVEDVVAQVPLSRRSLERRFRAAFGRTIKQDIQRVRIAYAQKLLSSTQLSVNEVARASGFNDRSQFFVAFRAAAGTGPREYRSGAGVAAGAGASP